MLKNKSENGFEKKVILAYCFWVAAIAVRMFGGVTALSDVLIAVAATVHVVANLALVKGKFKMVNGVSNILLAAIPITVVASFCGMPTRLKITVAVLLAVFCLIFALVLYVFKDSLISNKYFISVYDAISPICFGTLFGFFAVMNVIDGTDSDIGAYVFNMLIVSLIIVAALRIFASVRKYKSEGAVSKFWGQVGWFLLIWLLIFCAIMFTAITLNYSLDSSEGVEYGYEITDMRTRYKRKSGEHFYITVERDGKNDELSVTPEIYYASEIGDTFAMYRHDGFFGFEYYEYKTGK